MAHKLGTKVCILTEGNEEVTKILRENVDELKEKEKKDEEGGSERRGVGVLEAALHLWGQDLDAFEQRFPYKYDVIMGSDIVYAIASSSSPSSSSSSSSSS